MKGRTNYLCLHRFGRLKEAIAPSHTDWHWLARIAEWLPHTTTGDRAEIDDSPDNLPLWQEVTATHEQCAGRECPLYSECFVTRMRERASETDLVIVNHHLLCADASVRQGDFGEVIPECDILVVDEAHQLEEVATQYFGVSLSAHRLDEFVRDGSTAVALRREADLAIATALAASAAASRWRHQFFDVLRLETRGRGDCVRLTPEFASGSTRRAASCPRRLARSLAH